MQRSRCFHRREGSLARSAARRANSTARSSNSASEAASAARRINFHGLRSIATRPDAFGSGKCPRNIFWIVGAPKRGREVSHARSHDQTCPSVLQEDFGLLGDLLPIELQ